MKPVSRVLVVSADAAWSAQVVGGLNDAAARLDNTMGLTVTAAPDGVLVVTLCALMGATASWWIRETRCRNIWQPAAAASNR